MATNYHESELHIKAAAYLCSIGKSQKDLAAELGISQPTVSRLIAEARSRNLITTTHHLSNDDLREIETILYPHYPELCNKVHKLADTVKVPRVNSIRVYSAGRMPHDGVATPENREIFGRSVARHLQSLLGQMNCVGITWGKTLASIVQCFVATFEEHRKGQGTVIFFPVCGEAVDFSVNEYSASTHAAQLYKCVNAEEGNAWSLGSTPARIPKKYDALSGHGVREFIREAKAYRRIFLATDALIDRMDTLLATAGTIYRDPTDVFMDDLIGMEQISPEDLSNWTIGDIAGIFIPRQKLSSANANRVKDINTRWTGITVEQIRACANRARKSGDLGVILPVIGHSKADIVIESVRLALVNQLILDHNIADEIVRS